MLWSLALLQTTSISFAMAMLVFGSLPSLIDFKCRWCSYFFLEYRTTAPCSELLGSLVRLTLSPVWLQGVALWKTRHGASNYSLLLFLSFDHFLEVLHELCLSEEVFILSWYVSIAQSCLEHWVLTLVRLGRRRLDFQLFLSKLLFVELGQGDRTGGRIRVVPLESHVCDQRADVLLQFGQIRNDIVLSKDNSIVIVHLRGYWQEELGGNKSFDHDLDWFLHLSKHLFRLHHLVVPTQRQSTTGKTNEGELGQLEVDK